MNTMVFEHVASTNHDTQITSNGIDSKNSNLDAATRPPQRALQSSGVLPGQNLNQSSGLNQSGGQSSIQNVNLTESRGLLKKICRLGGGTYGGVYRCQDEMSGEEYAVKRNFIPECLAGSIGTIRELDMLNRLKEHPFCLYLKGITFGIPFHSEAPLSPVPPPEKKSASRFVDDSCFFLLERGVCDAETYIRAKNSVLKKPLVTQKKIMAVYLLLACEYMHSRGIYHRDIKPANIICFLNQDQSIHSVKLADFGLTQYCDSQSMSTANVVTLWYRAPEISLMKDYSQKVDVWSLACIFFEMFSNKNEKFFTPSEDFILLNTIMSKLPLSYEDYELARSIYGKAINHNYSHLQKELSKNSEAANMKALLASPISEIAQFDCSRIGGAPNFGKYEDFVDCLSKMLVTDPAKRFSASQCLNHVFFDGYRGFINRMRTSYGINTEGVWVLKPENRLIFVDHSIRGVGMKWFKIAYNNRTVDPYQKWYTHQILFHAIEMFDRYLNIICETNARGLDSVEESTLVVWVNTFLFIATKHLRVLKTEYGLEYFALGINPTQFNIYKTFVYEFEKIIVRDVFKYEIWKFTLFEECKEFMNSVYIHHLLYCTMNGHFDTGTKFSDILIYMNDNYPEIERLYIAPHSPSAILG